MSGRQGRRPASRPDGGSCSCPPRTTPFTHSPNPHLIDPPRCPDCQRLFLLLPLLLESLRRRPPLSRDVCRCFYCESTSGRGACAAAAGDASAAAASSSAAPLAPRPTQPNSNNPNPPDVIPDVTASLPLPHRAPPRRAARHIRQMTITHDDEWCARRTAPM